LKKSIEEIVQNLKSPEEIGKVLLQMSLEIAREFYRQALELLDKYLLQKKDSRLKSEGLYPRWVISPLGSVRVRRRKYRDSAGGYHYLLDYLLGLEGRSPITPELKEDCAYVATLLPFMKSAQVIEQNIPQAAISHTTVHRLVKRIAEPVIREEEAKRKQLYEGGKAAQSGDRGVPLLFMEADGVNIALQREKRKKAEIKIGIAYEGWQEISKGRHRLSNKTSYGQIGEGDSFWEGFSLKLAGKYDLAKVGRIVVGGDGAGWVKSGVDLLGGTFQLDRFHLLRSLLQALGKQKGVINPIYQACNDGDWLKASTLLGEAGSKAGWQERENIERVTHYLEENRKGLRDYRLDLGEAGKGLRRTGAIESNVDKLAANRMKKRGMSWTIKGARWMVSLLMITENNRLAQVCRPKKADTLPGQSMRKLRRILVKNYRDVEEKWLQATLPALYGPHVNRLWVRSLKHLSEVSLNV
jgi:hypothetical protein